MATTYTLISSVTVGSGGAATMTFSSIPQTYTDLLVRVSARNTNTSGSGLYMRFNSISSTYSGKYLEGDGNSAYSGSTTTSYFAAGNVNTSNNNANTFASTDVYIPNYAGSNNKSGSVDSVYENNAITAYITMIAGLLSNTAAITQIDITPSANSFAQYTTAYLYGISNA
jgi:hypothetical protein